MRLINARRSDDIQSHLKSSFAEFNRTSSPSKGRRYPQNLQTLVRQASEAGVALSTLVELTGASSTALSRWCTSAKVRPARRQIKGPKARRLEVIGSNVERRGPAVVVRLPSGVAIELGDAVALNDVLLASLATLGGLHVASR